MMQSNRYGILAIWHDLDPLRVADFCEWHSREHMPERLSVPGFRLGCRYEAIDSLPLVFNYYATESPAILTSPPYLERLNNPTEWTTRMMPALRNVYRAAGHEVAISGEGQGDVIVTLRFDTNADGDSAFPSWFVQQALPEMAALAGINKVHLWKSDNSTSSIETNESRARGGNTSVLDWTVAIEGTNLPVIHTANYWLEQQQNFAGALESKPIVGFYRLAHRLGRESRV